MGPIYHRQESEVINGQARAKQIDDFLERIGQAR
jgi:hypothetical protein